MVGSRRPATYCQIVGRRLVLRQTSRLLLLIVALAAPVVPAAHAKAECRAPENHEAIRAKTLGKSTLDPVFADGRMLGQRIVSLDPESLRAAAGAQVGDTITGANELKIDRPAASGDLWCLLGSSMPLTLQIERDGETHAITLSVAA